MPTFRHRSTGKRFLFIHIPRTAGRFIGANLLKNDCECEQGEGDSLWVMRNQVELSHYHREYYEKYLDVEDIPHFAVVRNPIDRFVSGSSVLVMDYGKNLIIDKQFLNYNIKSYGSNTYRNVFRPQIEFVSDNTHIWKYEDGIGKEFVSWLSGILGIDFSFDDEIEYPQDESSIKFKKTPHLIDSVREVYKEDFERFYSDQ
jgi:hypothetical protein